jgi:predicted transcriptional regulator
MTNIYKQDVSRFYQPLSSTEQLVMYGRMKDGHVDAREAIINSCLPLVIDLAKKFRYNNKHIDLEDMIQEGNIALIKAVDNWDIKKGNLTTVATWCIRSALVDLITDARYNVKHAYSLSRRASIELRKVKRSSFTEVEDIANDTGLTQKRVKKLLSISPAGTGRVPYDREGWAPETHTKGRGSRRRLQADSLSQLIVEDEPTSHKPCVGDLISLINTNLEGDQKTIFCLWAGVNSKKIGPKEIARSLGKTEKYVYDTIYGAKRILSRAAKG